MHQRELLINESSICCFFLVETLSRQTKAFGACAVPSLRPSIIPSYDNIAQQSHRSSWPRASLTPLLRQIITFLYIFLSSSHFTSDFSLQISLLSEQTRRLLWIWSSSTKENSRGRKSTARGTTIPGGRPKTRGRLNDFLVLPWCLLFICFRQNSTVNTFCFRQSVKDCLNEQREYFYAVLTFLNS